MLLRTQKIEDQEVMDRSQDLSWLPAQLSWAKGTQLPAVFFRSISIVPVFLASSH